MTQPTPYRRGYDFSDAGGAQPPGGPLDVELDALSRTLRETLRNMALLQRDDTALRNGIVGIDALDNRVLGLISGGTFSIAGTWATATPYPAGAFFSDDEAIYLTMEAHTSTTIVDDLADGHIAKVLQNEQGSRVRDDFTGNGVQTAFTLTQSPSRPSDVEVYVNGALVPDADYAQTGATVTFDVAPANAARVSIFSLTWSTTPPIQTLLDAVGNRNAEISAATQFLDDIGDSAPTKGASMVATEGGSDVQTELTDRGIVMAGRTLTTPLILAAHKKHIGRGRFDKILMSSASSGVMTAQPGGGDFNYFSETRDFFVEPNGAFTNCGDYARDIEYSAYGIDWNNKFWGGQIAAVHYRNSVGHIEINTEAARSPVGHLFETVAGVQNTVSQSFGGTTNIVGSAIKSIGRIDYLSFKNRAFDFFNELASNDGAICNANFDSSWFEAWGTGTVTFTTGGGRVTGYSTGTGDGVFRLGSLKGPRFPKCTFVGSVTVSGGYAPIFDAPHCVTTTGAAELYVQPDGFARGVAHNQHLSGPNSGQVALDDLRFTLQEYGSSGTLLEHFGVSATHTSLAVAELAGVGFATGMGHANLYTSEMDGGAWAYKTATLTSGRPDPWGGTTAFAFSGTAGQHYGNFYLPEFDGGGKGCIQFLIRAQVAGSKIKLRFESTGVNAFKRHNTYHFTDTRWRIITLRADLPAAGSYTSYIEIVDGTFDIAASQCSMGYDAPPILRGGQSVTGAFIQINRSIVQRASAIPVTGKWWVGDRIEYDGATAATRKRIGAICTVGDGTGVGTWVEYGLVANMGAAIPNIGGAPTAADHNAILAVLRAMGGIAP